MAIGDSSAMGMSTGESSQAAHARGGKQFPAGMRVVAIDDDRVCLEMLNKLLKKCDYQVTCFTNAVEALKMIKENKDEIDLIITDVHMPNFDGFQLLEIAGLQLDLPVIMLSANDKKENVMKGIMHGACDYLIKPVRFEELCVIWKHVARRRSFEEFNEEDATNNNQAAGGYEHPERTPKETCGSNNAGNRAGTNTGKRRPMEDSEDAEANETSVKKKQRVVWTHDLHHTFVNAISEIGVDKAVPKSILEKMHMDDLTRENVASHLQKYRLYLKRVNSSPNGFQGGFNPESSFSIDLRSFERFKHFHSHGRYRSPSCSSSSPAQSTGLSNTSVNSSSSSAVPNAATSSQMTQIAGGTGSNSAGPSGLTSANNSLNSNQMNPYRGINGVSSFPGTSNSLPQFNSNPNYPSMHYPAWSPVPFAPFGYPMTNVPPISSPNSMAGPLFGTSSSLIGGDFNSGTTLRPQQQPGGNVSSEIGVGMQRPGGHFNFGNRAGLQPSASSFNTSWSMPYPSVTRNQNNVNWDNFGPFFNNLTNAHSAMSGGMRIGNVSDGMGIGNVSGGMGTGIASGGMGTGIASGDMGAGIVSAVMGTDIVSGGMETDPVSGGMGTDIVSGGMETGPVSGEMETSIVSGMETGALSAAMRTGIVSGMETHPLTQGESVFGGANFGTDDSVADHTSASYFHGIDDVSISGLDELLSSMWTNDGGDGADSLPSVDDDFFN